jgi:polysaccharide pyruvyl transferase CsaB
MPSGSLTKIVLYGYYGSDNFGDEAILETIIRRWKRIVPRLDLTVVSSAVPSHFKAKMAREGVRVLHNQGRPYPYGEVAKSIREANLVVVGGGGLYNELPLSNLISYGSPVWLGRAFGVPTMGYGLGVGPIETWRGRLISSLTFRLFTVMTVRDYDSQCLVRELAGKGADVQLSSDPTFLLETQNIVECQNGSIRDASPRIAICPRQLPWMILRSKGVESATKAAWGNLCRALSTEFNARPILMSLEPQDDVYCREILHNAFGDVDEALIISIRSPDEMIATMGQVDLCVGMRLHSLIFSLKCHIPFVGICYQPKVSSFMADMGMSHFSISTSDLKNTEGVMKLIVEGLGRRAEIAKMLSAMETRERERALESERIMLDLLRRQGCETNG